MSVSGRELRLAFGEESLHVRIVDPSEVGDGEADAVLDFRPDLRTDEFARISSFRPHSTVPRWIVYVGSSREFEPVSICLSPEARRILVGTYSEVASIDAETGASSIVFESLTPFNQFVEVERLGLTLLLFEADVACVSRRDGCLMWQHSCDLIRDWFIDEGVLHLSHDDGAASRLDLAGGSNLT